MPRRPVLLLDVAPPLPSCFSAALRGGPLFFSMCASFCWHASASLDRAQSLVDELLTVYTQEVYRLCKRAGVAMPSLVGQQDRVATGRSRLATSSCVALVRPTTCVCLSSQFVSLVLWWSLWSCFLKLSRRTCFCHSQLVLLWWWRWLMALFRVSGPSHGVRHDGRRGCGGVLSAGPRLHFFFNLFLFRASF